MKNPILLATLLLFALPALPDMPTPVMAAQRKATTRRKPAPARRATAPARRNPARRPAAPKLPATIDASTWCPPIQGRITSPYGYRRSMRRMHYGIDFSLGSGDTIRAMADGVVTMREFEARGYGYWYQIDHEGGKVVTRYAHLRKFLVRKGARVRAGQPIAIGGNTGHSTGPHLHFEVRICGRTVNPSKVFDFNRPGRYDVRAHTFALSRTSSGEICLNPTATPRRDSNRQNAPVLADNRTQPQHTTSTSAATPAPAAPAATPAPAASVPGASASGSPAPTPTSAHAWDSQRVGYDIPYIVEQGDCISSISRANGVSVTRLCVRNHLSPAAILQIGTELWF